MQPIVVSAPLWLLIVLGVIVVAVSGGIFWVVGRFFREKPAAPERKESPQGEPSPKPAANPGVHKAPSNNLADQKEGLMATVEQMLQDTERLLAQFRGALEHSYALLRTAYDEIMSLRAQLAEWKTGVEKRDDLLRTAYGEIGEMGETISGLMQQVAEASQRIAEIGGPENPPEASGVSVADEVANETPAGPPAPPARAF